eukprot:maker-scaffold459_size165548-snap-gene-0.22 protein:Tk05711 transcript:maker-scaffold459_size165548-snap-gene-0.22-mRNA-1 annotation:"hypothetical protein SINV_06455"
MDGIFDQIKNVFKSKAITIDNWIFRLHYPVTFSILVTFALLVTANQYLGDPIDCIVEEVPQDVMDTYCWIYSTFSVSSKVSGTLGRDMAHPGVAPGEGEEIQEHKYYQWVCFTLFFQAALFYIPKFLWEQWEDGKVQWLVGDMTEPLVDSEEKQIKNVITHMRVKKGHLNTYAWKFFFCEFLNWVNVVGQIFFMQRFLDVEFLRFGAEVFAYTELEDHERSDGMAKVFPKVTKCTFYRFGSSGTMENFDGLCILPLNMINEKIFVFLWFWFILVAILSSIHVIYRLAVIFVSPLRNKDLLRKARLASRADVQTICKNASIGDWFLLHLLGKNIDPLIFKNCIEQLFAIKSICIDNLTFKLHYKATVVILVTCSFLVTYKQYIGDPIDCLVQEISQDVMDTYCWIHSTFSIPNKVLGHDGYDMAHPGVAPGNDEEVREHKYYQWVCFTLYFQAILFYIPRYLWKQLEGGKVELLVKDLTGPVVKSETKKSAIEKLLAYMSRKRGNFNNYAWGFYICEILNFVNVVGQIFFLDRFFDGQFSRFGLEVLSITELDQNHRVDPMAKVFPKVTKCTFRKFGPSGTIENFDGLCVLPLNIINEKIYVFLWFWFILVAIITGCRLVVSTVLIIFPGIRRMLLQNSLGTNPSKSKKIQLPQSNSLSVGEEIALEPTVNADLPKKLEGEQTKPSLREKFQAAHLRDNIAYPGEIGDWFIWSQLAKNIDPFIFKDIWHTIAKS